jgi:hypothetical protein
MSDPVIDFYGPENNLYNVDITCRSNSSNFIRLIGSQAVPSSSYISKVSNCRFTGYTNGGTVLAIDPDVMPEINVNYDFDNCTFNECSSNTSSSCFNITRICCTIKSIEGCYANDRDGNFYLTNNSLFSIFDMAIESSCTNEGVEGTQL